MFRQTVRIFILLIRKSAAFVNAEGIRFFMIESKMTSVKLPDGSVKEFENSVSVKDVAKSIGSRLAKDAMWGEINLQPVKLDFEIPTGDAG